MNWMIIAVSMLFISEAPLETKDIVFAEATVLLKNGKEKPGKVNFDGHAKSVQFSGERGKEDIPSDQIARISIHDGEEDWDFEYLVADRFKANGSKKALDPVWYLNIGGCKDITGYKFVMFEITNKGNIRYWYDRSEWQEDFLLWRTNEKRPSWLGSLYSGNPGMGGGKLNRKVYAMYFKDKPDLVERIKKEKWDLRHLIEVVDVYCEGE